MLRWLSTWALAAACLVVFAPPVADAAQNAAEAADVYTCPMHPEVTDTKPSRCPKGKMKLVPK